MNERTKRLMNEQVSGIIDKLKVNFNLPVFEDEIAEDEEEGMPVYNCFVYETSEFSPTGDIAKLSQNINIYYLSENQDDVDEQTIDIISVINSVKGISFSGSVKDRLQVKDTDRFIDRVGLTFKRVIPIECSV